MKSLRLFVLGLICTIMVNPAQAAKWIPYEGEVPENAVRIGGKQLPVCGGKTKKGFRMGWYDEETEVCRLNNQSIGTGEGGLTAFRLMVQPSGDGEGPDREKLKRMRKTAVRIHMSKVHEQVKELAKASQVGGERCQSKFPDMGKANTIIMEAVIDSKCKARANAYRHVAKMIKKNYNPDGRAWIGEEEDENVRDSDELKEIMKKRLERVEQSTEEE
ncbi:MAG: hypothetical protein VX294_06395 [Candidatus Latescibacterota bacterium]|nr:hypothetical protein [Candidatus Latescibacterota bacterium]